MSISTLLTNALKLIKSNSPEILTALGVAGVVTTSVLASKAGAEATKRLDPFVESGKMPKKEKFKIVWTAYIPPVISGAATIGCIVGSSRASSRRTAAAVTAYSLSQQAFTEYKEKVVEQLGKGKDRKVRDELAQDHVTNNPPGSREVIVTGKGHILCCELFTHRYFRSDMETIRRAENDINYMVNNSIFVYLDEFYDLIGLPATDISNNIGWDSDKLLELQFTTTMSEDGEPCLAFSYNYTKPLR